MAKVFHLYTQEGHALIFRDDEDFTVGWNALVIAAYLAGVTIYCFCLMSNHIHVLVQGDDGAVREFFFKYKNLIGRHLSKKYGDSGVNGLKMNLTEITDRNSFVQEVSYILRNPLKAGIDTPWTYRWSSCMAYFNERTDKGTRIGALSSRELMLAMKSKVVLPDHYLIDDGLISLKSFIPYHVVESRFNKSRIEFYRMITKWNLEDIVEEKHGKEIVEGYTDSDLLDYLRSSYGAFDPHNLESKRKFRFIREVRNRFGSSRKQLMRIFDVEDSILDQLL